MSGKEKQDIIFEIKKMKDEKNAIILAHYYQTGDIQDIADFVGDSLALSQKAASNNADIILFAGVKFMGETAKILAPEKKVLLPDMNAGCSLADSCKADDFKIFLNQNPGRTVVSYVNTTAEIKAMSDIICTSSNAIQIINSLPEKEKIIFAPDRNLGNYVLNKTGRDIIVWNGTCHVHEEFSLEAILKLKNENPAAKIIVHPECELPVRMVADFIGSTAALLQFTKQDKSKCYIVATEPGIIHQMAVASTALSELAEWKQEIWDRVAQSHFDTSYHYEQTGDRSAVADLRVVHGRHNNDARKQMETS